MEWDEQTSQKRRIFRLLNLLITYEDNCTIALVFRFLAEIQIILILIQLNFTINPLPDFPNYESFSFAHLDNRLDNVIALLSPGFVAGVLYSYIIIIYYILLWRLKTKKIGTRESEKLEYGLLLAHSSFFSYYINFISLMLLNKNLSDTGWTATWIILLIINNVLGITGARFALIKLRTSSVCSLRSHTYNVEGWIYKLIDLVIRIFVAGNSNSYLRLGLVILFLAKRTITLSRHEFNSFELQNKFWVIHGVCLGFLIGAIVQIIGEQSTNLCISISLLYVLVVVKTIKSIQERNLIRWATIPISKLKTEYDFEIKLNILEYLIARGASLHIEKADSVAQIVFRGILNDYQESLIKAGKKNEEEDFYDTSIRSYNTKIERFLLNMKKEVYRQYLAKHPRNQLSRLSSVTFNIQNEKENKYANIIDLMKLSKSSNIEIATLAEKILGMIYHNTYERIYNQEHVDVEKIIEYIKCSSLLNGLIKNSTSTFHEFWSGNRSKMTMLEVFQKARDMEQMSLKLANVWTLMRSKYSKNLQIETLLYSLYLLLIRGQPSLSSKISKDIISHLGPSNRKSVGNPLESCLTSSHAIIIMLERKNDGHEHILYMSKSIETLGHEIADIQSKGIQLILPKIYHWGEPPTLLDYIEKSTGSVLGKRFSLYLKGKNEVLHRMDCYLTLTAGSNSLTYILAMDEDDRIELGIICQLDGTMEAWTEHLDKELGISKMSVTKDLSLFDLFYVEVKHNNGQGEVLSPIKDYSGLRRRSMSSNYNIRKKGSHKSSIEHEKNEYLELLSLYNNCLKYKARKTIECAKSIFLVLEKTFETEKDDDTIPEERAKLNRKETRRMIDTLIMDLNKSTARSSSLPEAEDAVKKQVMMFKNKESSSQGTIKNAIFDEELERKIHTPRLPISLMLINRGVILYILLAIGFSVGFLVKSLSKIDNIPIITSASLVITNRHFILWSYLYYSAINLRLLFEDLIDSRYGYDKLTAYAYTQAYWPTGNHLLNQYDFSIKNTIPIFEPQLQMRFYAPIRVNSINDPSQIQKVDIFNFDRLIMDCGYRLAYYANLPIEAADPNDPRLLFIANNVLDDQYIVEESFFYIIQEDTKIKLRDIEYYGLVVSYVLLAFSLILYGYILSKETKLILDRIALAEAFNKIGSNEVESHLYKVNRFIELYEHQQHALSNLYEKLAKDSSRKVVDAKNVKDDRSKGSSIGRLNYKLYFLLFLILVMQTLVIGVSFLNLVLFQKNQGIIQQAVDNSVIAGVLNNHIITLTMTIYSYIYYDTNLTLRNKPFGKVWDGCVSSYSKSQAFYLSLLDQVDSDLSSTLNAIYTQDLCEMFPEACYDPIRPIVKQGAFALNSFMMQASIRIKREFELSSKTFAEKKRILYLEDFVNLEWAGYMYPVQTKAVLETLQTQILRTIDRYKQSLTISVGCFVSGFLIFLMFVWGPIRIGLRDQRSQVYEMMRILPLSVVKYNISIKTFWSRYTLKNEL